MFNLEKESEQMWKVHYRTLYQGKLPAETHV